MKKKIIILLLMLSLFLTISSVSALDTDDTVMMEDNNLNSNDAISNIHDDGFNSGSVDKTSDIGTDPSENIINTNENAILNNKTVSFENDSTNTIEHSINKMLKSGPSRSGNTFYISSNGNGTGSSSSDPTNWTNAYSIAHDNDKIYFLDGTYILENININKNLVLQAINGGSAIINANGINRVFSIGYNKNIIINGLTFINGKTTGNGGAISFNSGNLTIINCKFFNNSADGSGGAIYLRSGNLNISNTSFINNYANEDNGGAVLADNIRITHSNFTNNVADGSGGAIRAYYNLIISDSIFTNNTSIKGQGGVSYAKNTTVNNSVFVNNTSINGGGAIYSNVEYLINNSEFIGNKANSDGGAIASYDTGRIFNSNFTNNSATSNSAGAAYARISIEIVNSNFNNNSATSGSGGAVHAQSEVKINNSNFTNNVAGNGGAIYSNKKSVVNNSTFTNNSATDEEGGAIFSVRDVEVDNSNFINNHAKSLGGAISAYNEIIANNSNFNNNSAEYAGAVYSPKLNSKNNNFTNNKVIYHGGGIYADVLNSENDNFINNSAKYAGGGVFVGSNADIKESNFESNTAVNGGGLFSHVNATINKSNFTNNNAYDGSAIISGNLVLTNSNLENNTSKGYGIIYAENATIKNNKFKNNNALKNKEIYVLNELNQSNNTLTPNQIEDINTTTVKVEHVNNVTYLVDLKEGLKGYCLQRTLNFPDYVYLLNNLSLALNQLTGEDVSEYLKILIYKNYFTDKKDNITFSLWDFTDGDFRNSNNTLTKEVIALYNSGFRVPNYNASLILANGTQVLFNFYSAGSSTTQNLFLFNITYMGNNYDLKVEKITLNKTVINGEKVKFIIRVTNMGDTILHNVTVFEKKYDGLIYDSYIDEGNNWNYKNGKWIYKNQLNINESVEFVVVFNTFKSGNFTNVIVSSSNETKNKTTNNTTSVRTPKMSIVKISNNKTVKVGETVSFTIIVTNTGDCNLTGVYIKDNKYSKGLVYLSYIDKHNKWTFDGKNKWTYKGVLAPGESISLDILFNTTSTGIKVNTAIAGNNITNETVNSTNKTNVTKIIIKKPDNNTNISNKEPDKKTVLNVSSSPRTGNPLVVFFIFKFNFSISSI
ncbi:hypothetical protein [Methanobrevibacter sp. V74]|uniref:DUF7507 domain-containing protein n=1 Tax=Methanobrevibacter sp. V74 TaxID=3064279 RepID=UPI002736F136|nr:hypothetical protein [Methanobrevibacter sp. V74]